jgi:chromate reductase, NAD(P)H dehydrogenase (quinone)
MKSIAVLVGSIRAGSINLRFAKALEQLSLTRFTFVFVDIGSLPHYNDDLWKDPPESVLKLKRQVDAADAVLFVTPEYNRSFPGVLKNAIDWGSRPKETSSWPGKPCAVVGTAAGAIATAAAQAQLRALLPILDLVLMGLPEVYFRMTPGAIDDNLVITDDTTRKFLDSWVKRFDAFIERVGVRGHAKF